MSILKTLFRLEKHSCKNSNELVPQDSTNDQEEGYRQEEARSWHNGTVRLRIDICKGDSIDEN